MTMATPVDAASAFGNGSQLKRQARGRFVGGMHPTLAHLFGTRATCNLDAWFEGAAVYYTHTARTAIQRAVKLLGLGSGDEILVPAYHCGSEVDVLLNAGLKVILFRVASGGEIDFEDLKNRLTQRTKAVYVIHYFGFAQNLERIEALCRARNLHLVEDCALSLLTEVEGRRLGSSGDLAVYNLPKMLPTPDGGALVVNRPDLQRQPWARGRPGWDEILRTAASLWRQSLLQALPDRAAAGLLGWFRRRKPGFCAGRDGRLEIPESYYFSPALKDRGISRISAWLAERMEIREIRDRRRHNYTRLLTRISHLSNVKPLFKVLPAGVCPLSLPVLVRGARELAEKLQAQSIPAIAWWSGYHRSFPDKGDFSEACRLKDSVVALPVHQQLDDSAIEFIADRVSECLV
jgi:dTDP-4-amino-4,6-dideoxygalactose transaminase